MHAANGSERLADKTAIVTGGSSGIGRGIALAFAREGASVVVGDVREEPKDEGVPTPTAEAIRDAGGRAVYQEADVSDDDDAAVLVDRAVDEYGGLDVLVNNAGIVRRGSIEDVSEEDWYETMSVNLGGIFHCSRHAITHLRSAPEGRVVNVASQLGIVGTRNQAAYCASKGGVVNLTRQMAVDYSEEEITVNAVCPGPVRTSTVEPAMDEDASFREYVTTNTLTPRIGEPDDIGEAVVYLSTDEARFVTGHALVVDGGWSAH